MMDENIPHDSSTRASIESHASTRRVGHGSKRMSNESGEVDHDCGIYIYIYIYIYLSLCVCVQVFK